MSCLLTPINNSASTTLDEFIAYQHAVRLPFNGCRVHINSLRDYSGANCVEPCNYR